MNSHDLRRVEKTSKRWLGMGFLNHQPYQASTLSPKIMEVEGLRGGGRKGKKDIPSLKRTAKAPENRPKPKTKESYPNQHCLGQAVSSGSVQPGVESPTRDASHHQDHYIF